MTRRSRASSAFRVSRLFTHGVRARRCDCRRLRGVIGAPILSVYPGLDAEMLPLALIVVILGGTGSLLGALVGSFIIGFLYNFGQAMFPDLAYVILFLPMLLVLVLRPQGLFGKGTPMSAPVTRRAAPGVALLVIALALLATVPDGSAMPITSTSRARSCCLRCSLSPSTCWSAMAAWCRSAMPGCSLSRDIPTALMLQAGHGHLAADVAAVGVTLVASAVFAVLALRATGIGFLMITLALGQILWGIAYRWAEPHQWRQRRQHHLAADAVRHQHSPARQSFYFATLVVFLIALASMALFVRSPFGASLRGTRDQARRMTALGYNVWLIRFLAFLFSGFWSGIAGILFVYNNQFISPQVAALQTLGRGAADGDLRRHRDPRSARSSAPPSW